MSYSISIYGHGAPSAVARDAFETAVRTIRAANDKDATGPTGSLSANDADGTSVSLNAADVADEPEPAS